MAKIVSPDSDPTQPDPSDKFDDQFTVQYPNGDLKTYRSWFNLNPKTNKQRRKREVALKALTETYSLKSATHLKKELTHRKRKNRALGNRLRGDVQRRDEARRKDS
jgi:hypothetical protein